MFEKLHCFVFGEEDASNRYILWEEEDEEERLTVEIFKGASDPDIFLRSPKLKRKFRKNGKQNKSKISWETKSKIIETIESLKSNRMIIIISHDKKIYNICDDVYNIINKNLKKE